MKRYYAQTKAQRQADWLSRFSDALVTRAPSVAGKIEWDSANHFYYSRMTVEDAVNKYCDTRGL